jgi:hypothetical protein
MNDADPDDWETEDFDVNLDQLKEQISNKKQSTEKVPDESEWESSCKVSSSETEKAVKVKGKGVDDKEEEPSVLILVNLTVLSDGKIHNRFDPFSVNDHDAKKELCDKINADYDRYANDSKLIAEGTIRHCSERVWRDALESLRKEHKGQYWFPIFPPKKK